MPGRFYRRRSFWVSSRLQAPILKMTLFHIALFAAITAATLFVPLMDAPAGGTTPKGWMLYYLNTRFWPAAGLGLVIVGLHTVFVSHRIAGPLLRINRACEAAANGETATPIRLREKDYLQVEARAVGDLIDAVGKKQVELETALAEVERELEECRRAHAEGRGEDVDRLLDSIADRRKMLGELAAS